MIVRGSFQAFGDINLNGHHLLDWRYLSDIPRGGAALGDVLTFDGANWVPSAVGDVGGTVVQWDSIIGMPDTFPPDAHTHPWNEVTGKPTEFPPEDHTHSLTALLQSAATTGQAVVWSGTTWVPADVVNSLAAGSNILLSGATGAVTISVTSTPTFATITEGATALASKYAAASHTHTTTYTVNVMFTANGATLAATGTAGSFRIPTDSTLISASILADQSGTMTLQVYGCSYAGYTGSLTDLTGGNDLVLSGAVKVNNTTLTAWTTSYNAGDVFTYVISGTVSNITWAVASLTFEKVVS